MQKKNAGFLMVGVVLLIGFLLQQNFVTTGTAIRSQTPEHTLQDAFDRRKSDIQVQGAGVVTAILPDDLDGSRHQRFIVRLSTGQTVLVAHNIDLAPRITELRKGDRVAFFGEYEWNSKGGVIHWTHHDPVGRHIGGWVKHRGHTYQ